MLCTVLPGLTAWPRLVSRFWGCHRRLRCQELAHETCHVGWRRLLGLPLALCRPATVAFWRVSMNCCPALASCLRSAPAMQQRHAAGRHCTRGKLRSLGQPRCNPFTLSL